MRYKPSPFEGKIDLSLAKDWMMKIKKILNILQVNEAEDQIRLAAYQLEGDVDRWWMDKQEMTDITALICACFKELFFKKYFPY